MKLRLKIKPIFIIVILVVFGAGAFVFTRVKKEIDQKSIKVSGNIEGDEIKLSFRVQGKIAQLLVDEGSIVKSGDVVARLDIDELTKTRDQAKGQLEAMQHQHILDKLEYDRAENLLKEGAITAQKRDYAKTKMDADKANIEALQASLDLAEVHLGFADLVSPINSYILVKSSLAGEVVQIGTPVFTIVDLNNLWVTAYINERDLGRVKINQKAVVKTDTFPGKSYDGKVSYISSQAEFTPKFIQTTEERVKLVYRIKVRVDNSSLELLPGMPADAYIQLE